MMKSTSDTDEMRQAYRIHQRNRPPSRKTGWPVLLSFFGECVLCLVSGETLVEGCALVELAGLQGVEVLVSLQLALGDLEHFHSDVGAVVCGSLAGGQQILQDEAVFHRAQAISQAAHTNGRE